MSVIEYAHQFNTLGRFVLGVMGDEKFKMLRFKEGLLSRIQTRLVRDRAQDLSELLNAAIEVETDIKRRDPDFGKTMRKFEPTFENGLKKKKTNSTQKGQQDNQKDEACPTCGKHHPGKCMAGRCFTCGKGGHFANECPNKNEKDGEKGKDSKPKTNARVFMITKKEAEIASDVVTGTKCTKT